MQIKHVYNQENETNSAVSLLTSPQMCLYWSTTLRPSLLASSLAPVTAAPVRVGMGAGGVWDDL